MSWFGNTPCLKVCRNRLGQFLIPQIKYKSQVLVNQAEVLDPPHFAGGLNTPIHIKTLLDNFIKSF
jgi:hypothetical protein